MTPLLELRGIGKTFGGLRALSAVDLAVARGEIVGIMGANGAGKTTLFGIIAGHIRPSAGEILLGGQSIRGLKPDRICRLGICRTFQIVRPFGGLSVLENAAVAARFGRRQARGDAALAAASEAIAAVGLAERAAMPAAALTLSGQKRLEVARALASGADILLLDEVMAGLTPAEVGEMLDVIRGVHSERGLTLLVIEHVMRALMRLCDRILVLHHGETIAVGSPSVIAKDERVLAHYLGSAT